MDAESLSEASEGVVTLEGGVALGMDAPMDLIPQTTVMKYWVC